MASTSQQKSPSHYITDSYTDCSAQITRAQKKNLKKRDAYALMILGGYSLCWIVRGLNTGCKLQIPAGIWLLLALKQHANQKKDCGALV
ncbi:hypothetical protein OROGR_015825 [Orobanche gracilis]